MPFVRACLDAEMLYAICIGVKIMGFYNCGLDIQQFLA
jgi:hypothetical protein